ncbi:MAG: 50S ribosomal protein L4 [Bacteroidales bacterium]
MELAVYNIKGEETGKNVSLNESVYGIDPNDHAIYLDVKQYMANMRQGTHKTKERAEVTGSTKKIKRQKGTGTARSGDIKSPIFRGGGRTFGPAPRDYRFKLNKKVKRLARRSALSYKAKADKIRIIEDFNLEAPKTKDYINVLNNLKINEKKSLLVLNEQNKNIYLSSRNLQGTKVVKASDITTYDIMNASVLLLVESSVDVLDNMLSNQ